MIVVNFEHSSRYGPVRGPESGAKSQNFCIETRQANSSCRFLNVDMAK